MTRWQHGWTSLLMVLVLLPATASGRDWWQDGAGYFSSPAQWGSEEWSRAGGVVVLTTLAMRYDSATRSYFAANQSADGNTLAALGNSWGELNGLAGLTLLGLYASGDSEWQRLAGNGFEAIVLSGFTTGIGKQAFGRTRPSDTADPGQWFQGGGNTAFPSGHTTAAFALSTALAEGVPNPSLGRRVFFYGLATATAFARMYDQRHWLSDTVMGAAIGIHAGLYVSERHAGGGEQQVMVFPIPYGVGFVASLEW